MSLDKSNLYYYVIYDLQSCSRKMKVTNTLEKKKKTQKIDMHCVSFLLLCDKLPQTLWLKT